MTAPRRPPDDFKNELDAHLALERDALVGEGVDDAQAAVAARRALGNRTRVEESYYERRRWRWWDEIRQDVGLALRLLGRNKRFAAAVVATMALGVGANTALTGAIDEILWSPLNLPRAEEIVAIHRADRQSGRYSRRRTWTSRISSAASHRSAASPAICAPHANWISTTSGWRSDVSS